MTWRLAPIESMAGESHEQALEVLLAGFVDLAALHLDMVDDESLPGGQVLRAFGTRAIRAYPLSSAASIFPKPETGMHNLLLRIDSRCRDAGLGRRDAAELRVKGGPWLAWKARAGSSVSPGMLVALLIPIFDDSRRQQVKALMEYLRLGGVAAMLAFAALGVSACDDGGGLEEAGEEVDEAIDDAEDEL